MAVPMSKIKYQSPLAVAVEMMTSRIAGVNRSCKLPHYNNNEEFVIEFEIETLHSHLVNSIPVPYLFLLVLRLLAGQVS